MITISVYFNVDAIGFKYRGFLRGQFWFWFANIGDKKSRLALPLIGKIPLIIDNFEILV